MKQFTIILTVAFIFTGMLSQAQDSTARKELIGKYKFPAGSVVEEVIVLQDNGALMMNSSAGTSALEFIKGDTFNIVNFNGIAVFKRNEMKKITGVHIDASGYVLEGVKDSTTAQLNASAVNRTSAYAEGLNETSLLVKTAEMATRNIYRRPSKDFMIE